MTQKPDFSRYADGLVPVIVQDADTKVILMLGFMNDEAFQKTLDTGLVTFFSRSKQRLWTKGETSKNYLHLVSVKTDCDKDTLLVRAKPDGPVCHTGADTCFDEKNADDNFLTVLEQVIENRKQHPSNQSYTSQLFKKGINAVAQKVGEEAIELIIEAKDNDPVKFEDEAADLLFHFLILLSAKGYRLKDIVEVLKKRH